MGKTKIEWTRGDDGSAGETWNVARGCSMVSPGCRQCFAMKMAHRFSGPGKAYEGLTVLKSGGPVWNGSVRAVPEKLLEPTRWRKPRRIFVNSMSDLFHEGLTDTFIGQVFDIMARCPRHTFMVLTKRARRMREWFAGAQATHKRPWPLPNVWLGVSVEDQKRAAERIPLLLQCSAAVHWISAEPLLGSLDLTSLAVPDSIIGDIGASSIDALAGIGEAGPEDVPWKKISWVVCGGESGPGARPMHPRWARDLRDQCVENGVAYFFKQFGAWVPIEATDDPLFASSPVKLPHECQIATASDGVRFARVGKKAAGRELDGRTWDEYPEAR